MADRAPFIVDHQASVPLVGIALHAGHELDPEARDAIALDERSRLHEEDPWTDRWTRLGGTRVVALRSRFEVDLNRPRDASLYREPSEAWGLTVWRRPPQAELVERSLELHDRFYDRLAEELEDARRRFGRFAVLDLHAYNHRRLGPDAAPDDPAANPDVNVGTGTMDRSRWASLVNRFCADLRAVPVAGSPLDVRENVRFFGAWLPRWVHETFPDAGCALAIEVKKTFMDEWSGEVDWARLLAIEGALSMTVPGLLEELGR